MDLTGTQVHASVTRHKYNRLRHTKILNGYDNFNTSVSVGSLGATTNFRRSDVQCHVMTSEASRVINRRSHNINITTILSTLFIPHL